jgi:hypothetical protein
MKYENGKIYKLTCGDLTYYGSTTQKYLSSRLAQHKQMNHKITSKYLFEKGETIITLVEDFPCERKEQLFARERYYIENNECINKNLPTRTVKEWRHDNIIKYSEKRKEYYNEHKQQIKDKVMLWRENQIEKVKENRRNNYLNNIENNKLKMKQYREAHKEEINEKRSKLILCPCGCKVQKRNIAKHCKTLKHIVKLNK